jgi:glycosyltransferase involved in cell wall biosynthesis
LIVIDDGSTDNSAAIVQEKCTIDSRIKYYYQENSGVSYARNNGIKEAKGDFISFLDADDCWKPENLQNRLTLFDD